MSSTTVADNKDLAGPSLKTEDKEEIERPSSPDPPCAICLSELTNKSYTDSCLHTFCFDCLKEWAQIKAECPLCKQRFTTIIHNIRSLNDYDEHRINPLSGLGVSSRFYDMFVDPANFRRYIQPGRFRRTQGSILYLSDASMIPSYAVLPTSIEFRRAIYHEGRWVRSNRSNRQRECSPEFYRNNEAQTHRLLPWLSRELSVLLDVSMNVHTVCDNIMRLLVLHPITSSTFRNYILANVGPRTDHFLHEFYNYAISPEPTMQIYDFNAEYASINSSQLRHHVHRSFMYGGIRGSSGPAHFSVLSNCRLPSVDPEVVSLSDSSDSSDEEPAVQNNEAIVNETDSDDSVMIIEPPPPKPIEVITLDDSDSSLPAEENAPSSNNVHVEDIYANPQPSTSFQHENRIPLIVLSSSSSMSSSSPSPSPTPSPSPSFSSSSSSEYSPPRHKKKSRSSKKHKRKTKRSSSPSPKRKRRERKSYHFKPKKSRKNDKENENSTKSERRQSFSHSSSDEDVPGPRSFVRSVVLKCNKSHLKIETDSSPDSDF